MRLDVEHKTPFPILVACALNQVEEVCDADVASVRDDDVHVAPSWVSLIRLNLARVGADGMEVRLGGRGVGCRGSSVIRRVAWTVGRRCGLSLSP